MKNCLIVEREDGSRFQIRQGIERHRTSKLYSTRIEIMWNRNQKFENEDDLINKFEENLIGVAESRIEAICTTIYEDKSWFIFTLYINNSEKFSQLMNQILIFFPPLPIKVLSTNDPNWEDYDKTLNMINYK